MTECSRMRRIGDKCLCLSWVPRWREYAHMKAAVNPCSLPPRQVPAYGLPLARCVGG